MQWTPLYGRTCQSLRAGANVNMSITSPSAPLAADLRCLDAHAHLGNLAFDRDPDTAVRHYDMGVKIGELSLGKDFGGLLPWGFIENRPFLRCLHGYGLCMWRFGRLREAEKVFIRMLWLNPADNQGVRSELSDVKEGDAWHE
jgi:hypothetical protein